MTDSMFLNDNDQTRYEAGVRLVRHLEAIGQIKGPPATEDELRAYWEKLQKSN